jgi:hypothetical protein
MGASRRIRTTARVEPRRPARRRLSDGAAKINWKLVLFEREWRTPYRHRRRSDGAIKPSKPDAIEVGLVQLKAGVAGLAAAEVTRLKKAAAALSTDWLFAPYDGETLRVNLR